MKQEASVIKRMRQDLLFRFHSDFVVLVRDMLISNKLSTNDIVWQLADYLHRLDDFEYDSFENELRGYKGYLDVVVKDHPILGSEYFENQVKLIEKYFVRVEK